MLKIERNSQLLKVDRFLFGNANMAKIYERSLSTIIAQGKFRDSFDPQSQTLSGEESARKGDPPGNTSRCRLFFFFFITRLTCFGCFKTDVLFCQASIKIKFSTLSVHCYITFMLSSTEKCLTCFPQCFLHTF